MIEGGNSKYHDSLEELFILENIADLQAIRYKVFIHFRFRIQNVRRLHQTGTFYIFGFTHLRLLNEALIYDSD